MPHPARAVRLLLSLACLTVLLPEVAGASDPTEAAAGSGGWVAVLDLESNAAARDAAPGVAALVASRLAEVSPLRVVSAADVEALAALERQGLGAGDCAEAACGDVPAGLRAARYVVTGRLDGFGERFVLSLSALAPGRPGALARPRVEVSGAAELPTAARQAADLLVRELGLPAPTTNPLLRLDAAPPPPGTFSLGLRVDGTAIHSLQTLSPGADVELGLRFHPEWVAFLQVGLRLVRVEEEGRLSGGLDVVPGIFGARHLYPVAPFFQPYWGLGLGVQLAFGQFGFFRETGPLPALHAVGGLQFRLLPGLLLVLEGRTNVAQAVLGLASGGLGRGMNLDLSAGLTYEFR